MEIRHRDIFDIPSILLLFAHCTHHTTNSTLAKSLLSASAAGSEIQNMTTDVPSTARCFLNVLTCRGIFMLKLQQIGVHSFPEVLQREGQRWDLGRRENGNVNYSVCVCVFCVRVYGCRPRLLCSCATCGSQTLLCCRRWRRRFRLPLMDGPRSPGRKGTRPHRRPAVRMWTVKALVLGDVAYK